MLLKNFFWLSFNRLLSFGLSPFQYRQQLAIQNPELAQKRLLSYLCQTMASTAYGKHYGLTGKESYQAYCDKIPVVEYEDIQPWIEEQRLSQKPLLTPGKVLYYEATSGSSGSKKLIPYNRFLLNSFTELFGIWSADLLRQLAPLKSAQFYFSVTPLPEQDLRSQLQLTDDAAYIQGPLQYLLRVFAAVPSTVKYLRCSEEFFHVLACYLCANSRLELLSIWNPSFFLQILNYIKHHRLEISQTLIQGSYHCEGLSFHWPRISQRRLDEIQTVMNWQDFWPLLRFISCWDQQHAKYPADVLKKLFPQVWVQGKGLLATEAPLTVPISSKQADYPLPHQVFYEFLADDGSIKRLHELEDGACYELIVSQKAGLLRYKMGDLVKASRKDHCPTLAFQGRVSAVVDLVGEKLHENLVRSALDKIAACQTKFHILIPSLDQAGKASYLLLSSDSQLVGKSHILDQQLQESHHYALAKKLRQLKPVEIIYRDDAETFFYRCAQAAGQKLGDLKPAQLLRNLKLAAYLIWELKKEKSAFYT